MSPMSSGPTRPIITDNMNLPQATDQIRQLLQCSPEIRQDTLDITTQNPNPKDWTVFVGGRFSTTKLSQDLDFKISLTRRGDESYVVWMDGNKEYSGVNFKAASTALGEALKTAAGSKSSRALAG
jgi:hypothetical protein